MQKKHGVMHGCVSSLASNAGRTALPPFVATPAQRAGRARATAVSPGMQRLPHTGLAGGRVVHDKIDQRLSAQGPGQFPGLGLVQAHQRGVEGETLMWLDKAE